MKCLVAMKQITLEYPQCSHTYIHQWFRSISIICRLLIFASFTLFEFVWKTTAAAATAIYLFTFVRIWSVNGNRSFKLLWFLLNRFFLPYHIVYMIVSLHQSFDVRNAVIELSVLVSSIFLAIFYRRNCVQYETLFRTTADHPLSGHLRRTTALVDGVHIGTQYTVTREMKKSWVYMETHIKPILRGKNPMHIMHMEFCGVRDFFIPRGTVDWAQMQTFFYRICWKFFAVDQR